MNPVMMKAVADERVRDLHRSAAAYRLATSARPRRTGVVAGLANRIGTTGARLREHVRRTQLSPRANYCACP